MDALTAHAASARDLTRLGGAARGRGLYRHAAALWTTAVTLGSAVAAALLITHLRWVSPDAAHALLAHDPASHASLNDPRGVANLGGIADLGSTADLGGIAELLKALGEAGASNAVTVLATRAANAGMFDLFLEVCPDEASSYLLGRESDGAPSQSWKWQEPARTAVCE